MLEDIINALQNRQEIRGNLIQLKEHLREEERREELLELLADNSIFIDFLQEEDPKIRKNTALILGYYGNSWNQRGRENGALMQENALRALAEAYEREETLFVRSDYLKAMQNFDCEVYRERLQEHYQKLLETDVPENEKKHIRKERRELEKLLRTKETGSFHRFCGYDLESEVILTTDRGFARITAEQIRTGKVAVSPGGVRVRTRNLRQLLKIRTFREMLFPVCAESFELEPQDAARKLLKGKMLELIEQHLEGEAPYYFRIQIPGNTNPDQDKKTAFIKKAAFALEEESGYRLVNSKEHYELELRLMQNKEGRFRGYLKFSNLPLNRFSYRKNVLPVSIHPVQAALLIRLARPFLKEDAAVLDPFCGVGTMLLEREQILPARSLYGVDIYGEAIRGARENTELAGVQISYIQRDFFDFTHRHRFDEILTNMPVRGRKSKEEQDAFYQRFFDKAAVHLEKDGTIIMYTNENGFVKKQLRLHRNLELLKEYCVRSKDGWFLFIIRSKE